MNTVSLHVVISDATHNEIAGAEIGYNYSKWFDWNTGNFLFFRSLNFCHSFFRSCDRRTSRFQRNNLLAKELKSSHYVSSRHAQISVWENRYARDCATFV